MMRSLLFLLLIFFTNLTVAQLQFDNVATAVGADYAYGDSTFGGGVSFVDFNNDGWDDLTYSTDENQTIHFLQNNGGTFTRVTLTGINETNRAKQVLWIDYDNDGDKDFFVTNILGKNGLYQNDGNMVFTDVTVTSGLFTTDLTSYGATFGDIDNDGDLDLFICNRDGDSTNRNYLYKNNNGVFQDVSQTNGIPDLNELTFLATFFDYDNDGDQDLYIINDKTDPNYLYQNDGTGQFTDVSLTSGAGIVIDAMSCTVADYNSDGYADIYVSNTTAGNQLLENSGASGTFTNVAGAAGVEFNSFSWGATFLDADNDTNADLYVSSSFDGSVGSFLSAAFYHNDGDDTFTIPNNIGFSDDERESYANAVGDFNNDGKPDLVVMNDTDDYFLWENQTTTSNNWIKIKLEGVTSNKDGYGNKIEIFANGKSQYKFTVCGEGYLAQYSQHEFVGVGSATNIDYIKVTWNKTGIVETINNVQPNQAITIQEGNGVLSTTSEELEGFTVYPNPSDSGIFYINRSNSSEMKVNVFDIHGKQLINQGLENNRVDLSSLSSGIYLLQLKSENRTVVQKVIKN